MNDLNGEARLVLNRMSRELREAQRITAVINPAGPGYSATADSSITFEVDFNGNGTIEPNAADPEELTYFYDVSARQLQLQAAGSALPVLAANVAGFKMNFTSRRYVYDGTTTASGGVCGTVTGTKDGVRRLARGRRSLMDALRQLQRDPGRRAERHRLGLHRPQGALRPRQQQYQTQVDLRNAKP